MIKETFKRNNGGNGYIDVREKTVISVIGHLFDYEMCYGCIVTEITDCKVEVITRILGCIDTTTFEGTVKEMAPIVKLAHTYAFLHQVARDPKQPFIEQLAVKVFKATKGLPLLLVHMTDLVTGNTIAKATFYSLFEFEGEVPRETLSVISATEYADYLNLLLVDGIPAKDLVGLMTA